MAFSKAEYWENRRAGKRGQGVDAKPTGIEQDFKAGSHLIQIGSRLIAVNRAVARRKVVDHRFTSKTARVKSKAEAKAIFDRVKRTESGERERIVKLKTERT